jgi:O-methyltransferase
LIDIDSIVYNNTMCSKKRVEALAKAIHFVIDNNVPGDFVECGTWRGGLAALMLYNAKRTEDKRLYVYDTFEGMPEPGENDCGTSKRMYEENKGDWCRAGLDIVKSVLREVDASYSDLCYLIKGKVEDTLDLMAPQTIALARLDTDWYESTKKELEVLYPRVVANGFVLIDDYSDWNGCRQAVDEYLATIDKTTYRLELADGSLVIQKK